MKISVLLLGLIIFAGFIQASPKDDKVEPVQEVVVIPEEGVVYSLPQTGIRVHVKAIREKYVHGPYCLYAQKMLGIENVSTANKEQWVIDDVSLELFSEPDKNQIYKAMGPIANQVSLTENGVLAGINVAVDALPNEVSTSTFIRNNAEPDIHFTNLSMWSFYSEQDSLKSNKVISKNLEQKAAEAAETIFTLRSSRFNLLTNANDEPLPDGKAFEVMATELEKTERNYVELFIGKTYKQSFEYSFDFVPSQNSEKGEVVFRFNENQGVLDKTDLSGKPFVLEVTKQDNLASKQKELSSSENPDAGKRGVYYRMPGMADVRLMNGINVVAVGRMSIAQFGTVASIPEKLLEGNYQLRFYPTTGAVKSITKIK